MLLTLQNRGKWNKQQRNYKVRDVVILKEDAEHNHWPMAKIVALNNDAREMSAALKYYLVQLINQTTRFVIWKG